MNENEYNIIKNLIRFWRYIDEGKKIKVIFLFSLMIVNSFLEMLSVGSVFPFIGILISPEIVLNNELFSSIFSIFNIDKNVNLFPLLATTFITLILLSCCGRIIILYCLTRFAFSLGVDTGYKIYKKTLFQPYTVHVNRNSSTVINGIVSQTDNVIFSVIMSCLTLCNSLFMLVGIGIILLLIDTYITLTIISFFLIIYFIILIVTRKHLTNNGKIVAEKGSTVVKSLQEGLGGIRDIIVDGTQAVHLNVFTEADKSLKRAQGNIQIISGSPRYIVEAVAMIVIATLAIFANNNADGVLNLIPLLGTLAVGAQRLLPMLQEAYRNLSTIKGTEASLLHVLSFLDQKIPEHINIKNKQKIKFHSSVEFKSIDFTYSHSKDYIFKDLNYSFFQGERIGVIGKTGVGKSTFTNILMGLLEVNKGNIYIDKIKLDKLNFRSWQKQIAHVPQKIFLTDDTIYKNIVMGVDNKDIDEIKLKKAIKNAQLNDFINKLPNGFHTKVGELGLKLSGGEKQRIGIARALYKEAKIIIFDEATNSLDTKTEKLIMNTIYNINKNITLIIIAHRLNTLEKCDKIIEIKNNKVKNLNKSQINIALKTR